MEITFGGVILILFIMFIFRSSIKKVTKAVDEEVTVSIAESKTELYRRAQEAYDDLVSECGEDFKTPEIIYRMMERRRRKKVQNK